MYESYVSINDRFIQYYPFIPILSMLLSTVNSKTSTSTVDNSERCLIDVINCFNI